MIFEQKPTKGAKERPPRHFPPSFPSLSSVQKTLAGAARRPGPAPGCSLGDGYQRLFRYCVSGTGLGEVRRRSHASHWGHGTDGTNGTDGTHGPARLTQSRPGVWPWLHLPVAHWRTNLAVPGVKWRGRTSRRYGTSQAGKIACLTLRAVVNVTQALLPARNVDQAILPGLEFVGRALIQVSGGGEGPAPTPRPRRSSPSWRVRGCRR